MSQCSSTVLVTGGSGLLGRAIIAELKSAGWQVTGTAFSRAGGELRKCDLTDSEEIASLLYEVKPHYVIHAAAERYPDKVENDYERARLLNVDATRTIGKIAEELASRVIYISTDYVFDGSHPPYSIVDEPNPLNKYGMTKLDGERALLKAHPGACILRIPILYGPVEKLEESAVTCLLGMLISKEPKMISHYERRYPSHVQDVAKIVCDLLLRVQEDRSLSGIFQWSGQECFTKYDIVKTIGKVFQLSTDHIIPDPSPVAGLTRPFDSQMDSSRLVQMGISYHTPFQAGIQSCLAEWIQGEQ